MDPLTKLALAGTVRAEADSLSTETPVDLLAAQLTDKGRERALLLAAGSLAAYRQAGHIAGPATTPIEPATTDDRPAISPTAARLVGEMLAGKNEELLPEALERARRAGLLLPPWLLPAALDVRLNASKTAVLPVLGERGRWLARFNARWHWAIQTPLGANGALLPNVEAVWEEGTPAQRLEMLRQVRRSDPAKARAWLETAWKTERAGDRQELLAALDDNLSPDDEPFLETALDDRGAAVRKTAAGLLARLPDSDFVKRLCARADDFVSYTVGFLRHAVLTIHAPQTLPKDWQRDGIELNGTPGLGQREDWLLELLSLIPLAHWQRKLDADPLEIVAAARNSSDWRQGMLEGWARAAIREGVQEWLDPLWTWCAESQGSRNDDLLRDLTGVLRQDTAERLVAGFLGRELGDGHMYNRWQQVISALPRPWTARFGFAYLDVLDSDLGKLASGWPRNAYVWGQYMHWAALAVPPACFAKALVISSRELPLPEIQRLGSTIEKFRDILHIREQYVKEIPL